VQETERLFVPSTASKEEDECTPRGQKRMVRGARAGNKKEAGHSRPQQQKIADNSKGQSGPVASRLGAKRGRVEVTAAFGRRVKISGEAKKKVLLRSTAAAIV
jgi:hypothetical protein